MEAIAAAAMTVGGVKSVAVQENAQMSVHTRTSNYTVREAAFVSPVVAPVR